MGEAIAFYTLAALILGFAVLVVTARETVHSVLFLVATFLFVAMLYVLLHAEFLAVVQVLVYAGGIVVLYLFVVMLANLKSAPEAHEDPRRRDQHRTGRLGALRRLPRAVRGRVDPAAGGDAGRHRAREEGAVTITPAHYVVLSAALFAIGIIGVLVRRNLIIIFMSIELMLNAVNINLVAFAQEWQQAVGQVFALFVIAVAAAEAAVGLGIILAFYRNKETINIDEMTIMKW
jgi:NADH-quinone oxidoreductase subunit K